MPLLDASTELLSYAVRPQGWWSPSRVEEHAGVLGVADFSIRFENDAVEQCKIAARVDGGGETWMKLLRPIGLKLCQGTCRTRCCLLACWSVMDNPRVICTMIHSKHIPGVDVAVLWSLSRVCHFASPCCWAMHIQCVLCMGMVMVALDNGSIWWHTSVCICHVFPSAKIPRLARSSQLHDSLGNAWWTVMGWG